MAAYTRHARRGARHSGPLRPRNGNSHAVPPRFPQRCRTSHTAQAALGPRISRNPSIPQAPPRQQIGTQTPRSPPGTPDAASRGTRVRARAPGSALHAKPEWAARGPCPWPSVKKPTVRTDRPSGTDAVRYTSVDTATRRLTVTHADTGRDKRETARLAENSQLAGRFRRWWQVLGSNQRRLSRRFYSPLPPAPLYHR